MTLSKRTQYGLRAALHLAAHHAGGGHVQSRDLADREQLPTKFLEQVLLILRRAKLLESKVGSGGGYRLRRPPSRVTVAELVDALEPRDEVGQTRPPTPGCRATAAVQARIDGAIADACGDWTLADLAEEVAGRSAEMYYI